MTKVFQISTILIISTLLLIANGAPQSKDRKLDLGGKRTIKRIFEDHSYESSEEHSVEYNDHHHHHHSDKSHESCEDSHDDSNSSSLERKIDILNKTRQSSSTTEVPVEKLSDNKDGNTNKGQMDSKPEEIPNEVTEINTKEPEYIGNTQKPPQEPATDDIFSLLDQTTPKHDLIDPRVTKQLKSQVNPVRKRRHAYGGGFSYGYSIQHYIDPHYYVHKPQNLVPVHPPYSYVSFIQSPHPGVATPHPPIYHGNSGENHGHNGSSPESEESTEIPFETSSEKPDQNAVIPLATTPRPIVVKPTENSNNFPSFFDETDNTEYPKEVLSGTEVPNQGTEVPDTTDNVFINLFGTE